MRVTLADEAGTVLDVASEGGVLLPLDPSERAKAFAALTGALAMLAGITMPDARGVETNQCSTPNPRSDDRHRPGVVVPLRLP